MTVHVKNGWLPYPDTDLGASDWHINSIGAFTGTNVSYQIVILTAAGRPAERELRDHHDSGRGHGHQQGPGQFLSTAAITIGP